MCHLSMKLSDRFDPNQMSTSDKIVVKHISVKETLLRPVHTRQLSCMQLIPCNLLPRVDQYVAEKSCMQLCVTSRRRPKTSCPMLYFQATSCLRKNQTANPSTAFRLP